MRKIVPPKRWIDVNRAEHPPLMVKMLNQAVCGGIRWLETKELAEHISRRALDEGYARSQKRSDYALLGAQVPPKRKQQKRRRRLSPARLLDHAAGGTALLPVTALSTVSHDNSSVALCDSRLSLVTYDVLDCTFGGGFHTGVILQNGAPYTRVVAVDCDYDAVHAARDILSEFGDERFRLFGNRMSEIKGMFGERSFDAVMIDPGPSRTQLADPARGFRLFDEDDHGLDMRYGCQQGTSALDYLNSVEQHTLAAALATYKILSPQQSMKLAREIRRGRPFSGCQSVLRVVESAGNELPEEGWDTQLSRRKVPMSLRFLTSLRCVVNNELFELQQAIDAALLMLRDSGRLVVFTREKWEEDLVCNAVRGHPHALLAYSEKIDVNDVQESGFSRHTQLWVANKVKESAFVLRNQVELRAVDVEESSIRWMAGMYAGQTHGFPANNLTFEHMDKKERRIVAQNSSPPPCDVGDS